MKQSSTHVQQGNVVSPQWADNILTIVILSCVNIQIIQFFFLICRVIAQIAYLGLKECLAIRKEGFAVRREFNCIVRRSANENTIHYLQGLKKLLQTFKN